MSAYMNLLLANFDDMDLEDQEAILMDLKMQEKLLDERTSDMMTDLGLWESDFY